MAGKSWFLSFLVCLAWTIVGCGEHRPPQQIAVAVQGDKATKAALERVLRENPTIAIPGRQTEYSIRVVKPDPNIDYKILQVVPDPKVDYKIIVVNPKSQQQLTGPVGEIGDVLRDRLRTQQSKGRK